MFRIILVFFIVTLVGFRTVLAQERGFPILQNYSATEYGGHNQNWAVLRDSTGVLFVGNNLGVLRFDGTAWEIHRNPKSGIVRSLALGLKKKIYAGAHGEFGYLSPDLNGRLHWTILSDSLPADSPAFADVWRILVTSVGVFFSTTDRIFLFDHNDHLKKIWQSDGTFRFPFLVDGKFIMPQSGVGLCEVIDDSLTFIAGSDALAKSKVYAMLPLSPDSTLIQTRSGTWLWNGKKIRPYSYPAGQFLQDNDVYGGLSIGDGRQLFWTLKAGLVLVDRHGEIVQVYNKQTGLADNTVYDVLIDRSGSVWCAMNKGVSRIDMFSPINQWAESSGLDGAVYTITRHHGEIYVGTSQGIFVLEKHDYVNPWRFRRLSVPGMQCWALLSVGEDLLAAANNGLWSIINGKAIRIDNSYSFALSVSVMDSNLILVGLQSGFGTLRKRNEEWKFQKPFPGFNSEVRYIADDESGVWLSGVFSGFVRITKTGELREYGKNLNQRLADRIFRTSRGLHFVSRLGIQTYNPTGDSLQLDTVLAPVLPDNGMHVLRMAEDTSGNLWIGKIEGAGKVPYDRISGFRPFSPLTRIAALGDISVIYASGRSIWYGGYDGLIKYRSISSTATESGPASSPYSFPLLSARLRRDTLIYSGQGRGVLSTNISYYDNEIEFSFSDPSLFGWGTPFQYKLEGFDATWKETKNLKKLYSYLPEGTYTFFVRPADQHYEANYSSLTFTILPPFYRTWWAYICYFLIVVGAAATAVRLRNSFLEKDRLRLKQLVDQRTTELRVANMQLRESSVRLEKTIGIVKAINSELELDRLLHRMLEIIQPLVGMETGSVLLRDAMDNSFRFRASFGVPLSELENIRLTDSEAKIRYIDSAKLVAEDMFFVKNVTARPGTEKFMNFKPLDSLFVIHLTAEGGTDGFLLFDNVSHVNESNLLLLSHLKEHIRTALMKARLLAELKKLNEKKNEYLGIVAHDLRNPLTSIMGFASLIQDDIKSKTFDFSSAERDLGYIVRVTEHMNRFVTELLDISSIESGKVRLDKMTFDIRDAVLECVQLSQRYAKPKNITLTKEMGPQVQTVLADRFKIRSVLDNLVNNAIKYTQPGGTIHVTTETMGNEYIVHIKDNGQGLSRADLEKAFTSFGRLSSSPTAGEPSSGLGLAIVKKIVEIHNGRVWVQSELGKGSVFSFSLPAHNSDSA